MTKWGGGGATCEEVALSIHEEMPSGPVAVFNGSLEMRHRMLSLVQRSSSGQGKRGEKGGAEELKQEVKNSLRHWALLRSDSMGVPSDDRVGMEEVDLRRDLTKDQKLEGAA